MLASFSAGRSDMAPPLLPAHPGAPPEAGLYQFTLRCTMAKDAASKANQAPARDVVVDPRASFAACMLAIATVFHEELLVRMSDPTTPAGGDEAKGWGSTGDDAPFPRTPSAQTPRTPTPQTPRRTPRGGSAKVRRALQGFGYEARGGEEATVNDEEKYQAFTAQHVASLGVLPVVPVTIKMRSV